MYDCSFVVMQKRFLSVCLFLCVCVHLSCRRTEALRGGVVMGGGLSGSSAGGESECALAMLAVFLASVLVSLGSPDYHSMALQRKEKSHTQLTSKQKSDLQKLF